MSADPIPLPDVLVRYLEQRDSARMLAAAEIWDSLTDRERALVRDAAVMGYVQGTLHTSGAVHPKDHAVIQTVVTECMHNADLYPSLGRKAENGER